MTTERWIRARIKGAVITDHMLVNKHCRRSSCSFFNEMKDSARASFVSEFFNDSKEKVEEGPERPRGCEDSSQVLHVVDCERFQGYDHCQVYHGVCCAA